MSNRTDDRVPTAYLVRGFDRRDGHPLSAIVHATHERAAVAIARREFVAYYGGPISAYQVTSVGLHAPIVVDASAEQYVSRPIVAPVAPIAGRFAVDPVPPPVQPPPPGKTPADLVRDAGGNWSRRVVFPAAMDRVELTERTKRLKARARRRRRIRRAIGCLVGALILALCVAGHLFLIGYLWPQVGR